MVEDISSFRDTQKTVLDYLKHLTGLATGSIIMLTLLLEKFFTGDNLEFRVLIGLCFIALILSTILFSLSSYGIILSMRESHMNSISNQKFTGITFIGGFSCYIIGLVFLVVFAVMNWY